MQKIYRKTEQENKAGVRTPRADAAEPPPQQLGCRRWQVGRLPLSPPAGPARSVPCGLRDLRVTPIALPVAFAPIQTPTASLH